MSLTPSPTSWCSRSIIHQIRNTAVDGRYRIEKEVLTDPWRDVVLQRVRFVPLQGALTDFRLYALLAPHLSNRGSGNTAWVGDYKGTPMLYLEVTQEPDGHWSQNMWLDGTPYWRGVQINETALPILLVDLASREGVIDKSERAGFWPMVRQAAVLRPRRGTRSSRGGVAASRVRVRSRTVLRLSRLVRRR